MTIQPTSSHSQYAEVSNTSHKPAPQKPQEQAPDTVQLSAQARKASGDVDHDGDSH
jgi:hypothetical protein